LDVAVEPLWLELISCPATTFVVVNRFDCATAHPLNGADAVADANEAPADLVLISPKFER
jgi:hypothetical protein